MTKPKESLSGEQTEQVDTSGYTLWLDVPDNGAVADGRATNVARVKLASGGYLQSGKPIVFQIISGSAVFDDGSTEKVGPNTDSFGRSSLTFTDKAPESGQIIAWMQNNPSVRSNGASYTFTGTVAPKNYAFALSSLTPGGEPADGKTMNIGRVVVTENGGRLTAAQIVKFVFNNGAASFDTSQPYVQPLYSTSTVLYVETHFDDQSDCDIADAYFDDASAETVTLVASLVDHPEVEPKTQGFEFVAPPPPPPPPRYKVTITDYPSSVDDESSAPVSGTVIDTKTEDGVTGRCAVGCGGLLNGPNYVDAANGNFSFSVYGGYLSKGFVTSPLTVSYEDGNDTVNITVVPPFAERTQ